MVTIVIGAGVIGLMCARSLGRLGQEVILLDKSADMHSKASWAGGGMGMPSYPWRSAPEIMSLVQRSYELYPILAQELMQETGIDIQWHTSGILTLEADEHLLARQWADNYNFPFYLLSPEQIKALMPALAAVTASGIWLPTVAQFRNPRLLKALDASIERQASIQRLTAEVQKFAVKEQRIVGLETSAGYFAADAVVIAAGAWSATLVEPLEISLDVFPIRGQMLLWEAPSTLVPCMVISNGNYLIPRKDGRVLVGASLENVGFDNTTTQSVYDELYEFAVSLVPELANYPVVNHWSGLRPGSAHGIPVVGEIGSGKGINNLWVNVGHFRNGLIMAPATNELLIDRMLYEKSN